MPITEFDVGIKLMLNFNITSGYLFFQPPIFVSVNQIIEGSAVFEILSCYNCRNDVDIDQAIFLIVLSGAEFLEKILSGEIVRIKDKQ